MTSTLRATTARIPTAALTAVATSLVRAGHSQQAADLIAVATAETPDDEARLALAAANAALESDYRSGTRLALDRIAVAETMLRSAGTVETRWDLDLLRVRQAYAEQLFGDGTTMRFGPAGRNPDEVADLRGAAEQLLDQSPDQGRRGWALMYLGFIVDNVLGEREASPAYYREALESATSTGDDYLAFEALRHLGDHDHDDGDHDTARERWERSTEHAARAGTVAGTLAQQLLLAVLHRDAGDDAGATALAREIVRWAGAIGATRLQSQAEAFLAGVDPTAPPPDLAD